MKKILFAIALVSTIQITNAQKNDTISDASSEEATSTVSAVFNKWSIELGVGPNKPLAPFETGYSSVNPEKNVNAIQTDHFEGAVRYMFNNKFGLKLDVAVDKIKNQDGSLSKEFMTDYYRLGLQGVINLGRLMSFEDFTSRISILGHLGVQAASLTPKFGPNTDITEYNLGLIYGITPQVKLANRVALYFDISMINNFRQHYTWDGQQNSAFTNNTNRADSSLEGRMVTAAVGFHIYLGGLETHADWTVSEKYVAEEVDEEVVEETPADTLAMKSEADKLLGILARLDELEKCQKDKDKDGVNDCIDEEENTKEGAWVDTKGRTQERPKNGVDGVTTTVIEKHTNPTVITKGSLLNIFYDVNKDTPNASSLSDVSLIIGYMITNPESKIRLIGYADTRGGSARNLALSQRRAKNLTASLVAKGISTSRIRFDGFGTDKKIVNPTKEEMDYARRTEVIVE